MSANQPSSDPFSPARIAAALEQLPASLYTSDARIAELEAAITEAKDTVEVETVNASLAAPIPDKSNEAQRKLLRDQAVAADPNVREARARLTGKEMELEHERANNKMLARQFAAMCHIAEMKAASMILQAKGATR